MDALIIFSDGNEHPLNWMLDKVHRHVWCAVKLEHHWVSYNWHQGNPIINIDQTADLVLPGAGFRGHRDDGRRRAVPRSMDVQQLRRPHDGDLWYPRSSHLHSTPTLETPDR
jgi:hypothetical protein